MLTKKRVSKIISYLLVLILSMESIELGGFSSIKAYGGAIKSTISLNGLEDAYFKGDIIFKDGSDQKIDLSKDDKGAYVFYYNDLPIKIANPIKYANEFTGWSRAESTDAFKDVVISEVGNYTYNANFEMSNVLIYYDDDVACQNYNGTPLTNLKRTPNEILTNTGLGKSTLETPCELLARIFGWQGDINAQNPWVENNVTFTSDFNNIKWDDLIGNYTMIFICFPNDGIVDYADKLMQYANDGGCLTLVGETNGGWAYGNKVLNNLFKQMGVSLSVGNNVAQYGNTCKVLNPDHPLFEGVTTLEGGAVAAININGQKTKDNTTELLAMPSTDGKDYVIMTDTKIGNGYITLMCDIDMWAGSGATWAKNLDPAYSRGDSKAFIKKMDIRSKENIRRTKSMKSISYSGMEDASLGVDDENNPYVNPNKYDADSFPISLYNPSKEGYSFMGWSGPGLDGNVINAVINKDGVVVTGEDLKDLTYTAHWKKEEKVSVLINDWTYKDTPNTPVVSGFRTGANVESIKYYTDSKCTKLTSAINGANDEGGVPSEIGTYYVKATIEGDDNYLDSFGVAEFKIKPIELKEEMFSIKSGNLVKGDDEDFLLIDYDGKAHGIEYEINYPSGWKYGKLINDTDYKVIFSNTEATDVGEYYVNFKGINHYTGNITIKWKIENKKEFKNIICEGFDGCPDGTTHFISIKGIPNGATVLYGEKEGSYDLKTNPEYLSGKHKVYFKISKKHYIDYTGFGEINIEHKFSDDFIVDKNPTCEVDGSKSRHCTVDGCEAKTDITILPKLNHNYETNIIEEATCTKDGIKEFICKNDKNHNYKENIPALGHDWEDEWTVIIEPTNDSAGKAVKKCKRGDCGEKLVKILPALNDEKDSIPQLIVEAEIEKGIEADYVIINNTKEEILNAPNIFTSEEKNAVLNGTDARVWLQIKPSDMNSISENEKALIEDYIFNYLKTVDGYEMMDISLLKKVGAGNIEKISEPGTDISFSIKVSNKLINNDESKYREFYGIFLHNNKVSMQKLNFNEEEKNLDIITNGFSLFTICYIDKDAGLPLRESGYVNVFLTKDSFVYTGDEIRPKVKVYYVNQDNDNRGNLNGKKVKKTLKLNVDYVLTYENNINKGIGKVTCKGIGDYNFVIEREFEIVQKSAVNWKIENDKMSLLYDGTDKYETISNNIIVLDKGRIVSPDEYILNIIGDTVNPGKVTVSLEVKPNSNYKGKCSKAKTVISIVSDAELNLTNAELSFKNKKNEYTYTGRDIKPKLVVCVNGKKISKKYYSVIYKNNINAGEAYVYVVGKGSATGISKTINFKINPMEISKLKVKKNQNLYWRNSLNDLKPVIKCGRKYLTKDVDYTMEVQDISIPEFKEQLKKKKRIPVTIIIRPCEKNTNFIDSSNDNSGLKLNVYVTKSNLAKSFVTSFDGNTYVSEKGKIKPTFSLYYLNEKLEPGVDYKYKVFVYSIPGINRKYARAKIKGIGLYKGSMDVKWIVSKEK